MTVFLRCHHEHSELGARSHACLAIAVHNWSIADLDGDGKLDLVVGNIRQPNAVYLGHGDGNFESGVAFGHDEQTYMSVAADLDGDGDQDLVISNVRGLNAIYLNDGSGTGWTEVWLGEEENSSYGVSVADLNGDGLPEIGFANSGALNRLFMNTRPR